MAIANAENLGEEGWPNLAPIDRDREWQAMREAVKGLPVDPVLLEGPCTLSALEAALRQGYHGAAFRGPRPVQREGGPVSCIWRMGPTRCSPCRAGVCDMLGRLAVSREPLRLVFLASCETATRSPADAFRGLAREWCRRACRWCWPCRTRCR